MFKQRSTLPDCIAKGGTTLLHLAVALNDLSLVKYLLSSGICDVDCKDDFNNTALLTALELENFDAVKILLDADANLFAIDRTTGSIALKILLIKLRKGSEDVVPHYMKNLKRSQSDLVKLIRIFAAKGVPPEHVYLMNDTEVSRTYLELRDPYYCRTVMKLALERHDFESVKWSLRYCTYRSQKFVLYKMLIDTFMQNITKDRIDFLGQLVDCNLIGEMALHYLDLMYRRANWKQASALLDFKFHEIVSEKLGVDLRVTFFGNKSVNAIELIENQNFDVNAAGTYGRTALEEAALQNLVDNVKFLLHLGADPNKQSQFGSTALDACQSYTYCYDTTVFDWNRLDSGLIILEYGADVQATIYGKSTVIQHAHEHDSALLECFIAQLVLQCHQGVTIKQRVKNFINSKKKLKKMYKSCCAQLKVLKRREIVKSVTFFRLLTEKSETLYRFLGDVDTIFLLEQYKRENDLHLLYYTILKSKLQKSLRLYRCKCYVADLISEITGNYTDFDNVIVRNIFKYFEPIDVYKFMQHTNVKLNNVT